MDYRNVNRCELTEIRAGVEDHNYRFRGHAGRNSTKARKTDARRASRRTNKAILKAEVAGQE